MGAYVFKILTTNVIGGESLCGFRFINQEIQMHQSMWIVSAWHCISTEVTVKGVEQCSISNAMDGTNNDSCGMARKMGMSGRSAREMRALTMNMETVTPIGKGK